MNDADPIDLGLEVGVNLSPEVRYEKFLQKQSAMNYTTYAAPTTGEIKNLVVYIRFSDESEFTQLTSTYDNMFNSTVASYNSMYNYYQEVSYNTLDITSTFYPTTGGTTVVSYQDGNPRSYYQVYNAVTNPNGYQGDTERRTREHALLRDAVLAINSQVPIGLNLDGDNDGNVDNVCFIVKGSPDGWSELLWPHMWSLYTYSVSINGKRVYTFNFQLETTLSSSGVGVLCHEMFHSIGAPDLYHYTSNGIAPVGKWDIMENDRNPPQHMGAYMKFRYGQWISSIPEILSSGQYTLNPLVSSSNNCYKIASPNTATEYFVVEYRKQEGPFESSVPGSGLIVYRINSSEDGNGNRNGPPDEVYIYRPDGTLFNNGSVDLANYSSDEGRTSINDLTNPSSFLSSGSAGGLDISNIGSSGSTISFDVTIGGSQSSILVTSPNGGESWEAGLNKTITWGSVGLSSSKSDDTRSKTRLDYGYNTLAKNKKDNSITNITNVKIEYSTNNGSDWIEVIASTSNDGSYSWAVPNTPSSQCKVKISDVADPGVSDESDAAFTISAPGSTITSLDEDFELYADFVLDLSPWTLVDVDGSTTYGSTSFDFTNEGSPMAFISFNPSNTTPPASATWDPHGGNKYAACFASITPPNNDWLISPQVTPGSSGELKFWARSLTSQYGLERFKVGVSTTGTSPGDFTIISAGSYLAAPTVWTQYTFDLSAYEGADIYVGINCVSNDAFVFMVDDVTITSQQVVSSITIVSPNGGEVWDVGSSHDIDWGSTGLSQNNSEYDFSFEISNVKIEYSTNNGSNWNSIVESTSNDGSYSWEIPDSPSLNCLVKITDTSDPAVYDISDENFEIRTPVAPTYTVTTSSNPLEGGATTGDGIYNEGSEVTVTATLNTGWQFVNWTENGSQVSSDLSYVFTIQSNRDLIANFSQVSYIDVSLPDLSCTPGVSINVPVTVSNLTGENIIAYQFKVTFDNTVLNATGIETSGTLSDVSGWTVLPNPNNPGEIIVGAFGANELTGSGILVYLNFDIVTSEGSSILAFQSFTFNSGDPNANTTDGSVTVTPEPPDSLIVTPENRDVTAEAGSTTFDISSNVSWMVIEAVDWLSVSPLSGSDNGTITVNYDANITTSQRIDTITVSGGGIIRKVTVTQAKAVMQIDVILPDTSVTGSTIMIPIYVSDLTGGNVIAFQFSIGFDDAILNATGIETGGTLSDESGWSVLPNPNNPGEIIVGAFGANSLEGSGILLYLEFNVVASEGSTELSFTNFVFNSGDPEANTSDGNVTISTGPHPEELMYLDHTPGNLMVSVFNNSRIGSLSEEGIGVEWGTGVEWNGINGLYRAGIVYGTTMAGFANGQSNHYNVSFFDMVNEYSNFTNGFMEETINDVTFNQVSFAAVSDANAPNPYGLMVLQKTYSRAGEEVVFYRYGFVNSTEEIVEGILGGVFFDWDVGNYESNSGGIATSEHLVYVFEPGESTPYFGVAAISGLDGGIVSTNNANTEDELRQMVFGCIGEVDDSDPGIGDQRSWAGTQLGNINVGDTSWVTFAIVAGDDLFGIRDNANRAFEIARNANWTDIVIGVNEPIDYTPVDFKLIQNYPNPFNPSTKIEYSIQKSDWVSLKVYDVLGNEVATLVNKEQLSGIYKVEFDASNFSSGVYYYQLRAGDFIESKKMVLLK
ncbi:MAG: M6 family metalloprotease domain-containing protein [Melioribacteraceae bacterium]|nr:M6 family metalloprotease domain-containing protein [Melioribacteraceae bacterium]